MLGSLARFSLLGVDRSRLKPFTKCERSLNATLTVPVFLHVLRSLFDNENPSTHAKARSPHLLGECWCSTANCPLGLHLFASADDIDSMPVSECES